jgi:hypothetical protein
MNKVGEVFHGTKGSIEMNDAGTAFIKDLEGGDLFKYRGKDDPNPYQVEHDRLFASIRSNGVISDAENGAMSTMTAIMGRMATYSGKVITLEEAMKSNLALVPQDLTWESAPPVVPNADGLYEIPMPGKAVVM